MSEEEYYSRMSKLNARISTDRVSEDEAHHITLQKNYLSTQYIKNIESQLQEKEKIIIIMEKYFELICDLGFDYDGCNTKESLKNLIDELVHYSNLGRVANTTEEIYMNKDKSFNILYEEIVDKEI